MCKIAAKEVILKASGDKIIEHEFSGILVGVEIAL